MTPRLVDAELMLDAKTELGEGPVWDPRAACLYFVDILRGHLHRCDPLTGATRTYHVGQSVGAIALTETETIALAVRDGFGSLDLASGRVTMIVEVEADRPDLRMNDGNCDSAGRFWAGTMALDEHADAGALYRLDARSVSEKREHAPGVDTMLRPVTISNGIDWTDDDRRMYFIDSPTQVVDAFDFEASTGGISNRRPFVRIPREQGVPDGLTIDAEGGVWVSLWSGGAVHRYTPDGTLDCIVRLPVTHPTSCAFGGPDLRDLYITTASIALKGSERDRQPLAGGVFRSRPGPTGRPPHRFRD